MSIDIQIWSDIACPWCFIGKRRFERALAAFPQRDQVRVTWRSYQLDPTLPEHYDGSEVDYLVSAKGERLPPEYAPEASGLKVLIGPEHKIPAVGDAWLGGDVQAGLALLNCLRRAPESQREDILDQARAIDISEYSHTKNLYIVTDTGSRILWGGEPGTFVPGQARDDIKLDRLARLIRDHGRIDASRDFLDISLAGVY